jgi:hypothetical protein
MKLKIALLAVPLFLIGCATSKAIQGPNGTTAYFIKCGSAAIDACYEEAAKVCPKGYTLADRQSDGTAVAMPMAGGGFMMARGPNTMLVECKP